MFKFSAVVFTVVVLMGCSQKEPVKIAVFGSTTGPTADLGIGGRNGVILAAEQFNKAGDVIGRTIELSFFDAEGSMEKGRQLMNDIVSAEPMFDVVVGPMTSSMAMNIKPITDQHELLLFGITTSSSALSGQDDFFLRSIADTSYHARSQGRYTKDVLQASSVCLVTDQANAAYTNAWADDFESGMGMNADKSCRVKYTSAPDTDFTAIVRQVVDSEPDMVVLVAKAADAAKLIKSVRDQAPDLAISTAAWAGTQRLIEFGGVDVEGVYVTQSIDRYSSDPDYLAFVDNFKARFGGA